MKIIVNKEPVKDVECDFFNDYETKAEFIGSEDANTNDLLNMVFDAMLLESYMPYSIIKAMIDIAYDKASWFSIDFDEILKTTLETESDEQDE